MSALVAIAVGKFDALHLGHRALADRAADLGHPVLLRLTGLAEAFAWTPRPAIVAEADRPRVLAGWDAHPEERTVDIRTLCDLAPNAFLDWLIATHAAGALVIGHDFRCGRGRTAGIAELAPLCAARGLHLAVVEALAVEGSAVSSSRIREALGRGEIATAHACLGRPHRLLGTVRRGDGRGRTLAFPTANLGAGDNLVPSPGVYAARAHLGNEQVPAAVNIGVLPTIGGDRPVTIEAHLCGWTGDCYGAVLGLDLLERIRAERRFASLDELRTQIASDVAAVRRVVG